MCAMLTTIDSGTIVSNRDKQDLAAAFRQAFRSHPAGIAIVSANSDNGPVAVRCLFWVTPTGRLFDLFEAIHDLADPAQVVALAEKHDVHFLPE